MKFIPLTTLLLFLLGLSLQTAIAQNQACTISRDDDADGTPDFITTNTYDANGNLLTESLDGDGDGTPDAITTNTYDSNGNILTNSLDFDADGTPNFITTSTYDSNGNLLTESNDFDGDGTPDEIRTYTYDSNGNLLTESIDGDADGTTDNIVTYTYDSNGNLLTDSFDDDADGTPERIFTNIYDTNGNLLTASQDDDADGTPERILTNTYDSNGNLLTSSSDSDADGMPNAITTNTYDVNGNLLSKNVDKNGDGMPNDIFTYTYDANGNLLTDSTDFNRNGIINEVNTYTYDANGNLLTRSSDWALSGVDGTPNQIFTYTYDANGNLLMISIDNDADGTPDNITTYTYGNCTVPSCTANAGELGNSQNAASLSICAGTDNGVVFEKTGASMDEFVFLLVNASGMIVANNSNGDFDLTTLSTGTFTVYGLSYASSNTPSTIAAYLVGKSLSDIQMDDAGTTFCLDLSNTTLAGETNSLTINANPSASLAVTETSGGTNNDGILANGDPFTLTASGGSSYQFFIDQNNNGTFESASDTDLGTNNPLNTSAGNSNFPPNMTTKVSVIATDNAGCASTAATQDIEVLNTVNINAAVVNTCTKPYTANFPPLTNAVAYRVEIVVPAPINRTLIRTVGPPPLSYNLNLPNGLTGQMVTIRIAPIFIDPNTGQQTVGMFSNTRNFTIGCNPNPATGNGVEGRSEEMLKEMQLQIAPNPVQVDLQIRLEQAQAQRLQIQILDVTGRSLRSIEQESEIGENQWTISIGDLPSGLYYVQVRSAEDVEILGFMKE